MGWTQAAPRTYATMTGWTHGAPTTGADVWMPRPSQDVCWYDGQKTNKKLGE
jgi:hypothetical protein